MSLSVSDAYFGLPDRPPVSAGMYPFHTRGSIYIRDLDCYRATMPAAQLEQAFRALPDPSYERFFTQRFVPTDWYDVLPAEYLRAAVARVRGLPASRILRDYINLTLKHSQGGITGLLLKSPSAESVAKWVPQVSANYYDFGVLTASVVDEHHVRCVRSGVPRLMIRSWAVAVSEFIENALAEVGAVAPHVSFLRPEPHGMDRGYEVYRIPYEISWSD